MDRNEIRDRLLGVDHRIKAGMRMSARIAIHELRDALEFDIAAEAEAAPRNPFTEGAAPRDEPYVTHLLPDGSVSIEPR